MQLSDDDKACIADHIARGEPLPDRFRWTLFREPREAELIWPGKTSDVTNVVLPFQSIEQIDEPRSETGAQVADLFQIGSGGRQGGGWSNKLIWGDNKLVLSSLNGGPLRREIEAAGGLKLVYIDPPFDVGADFSHQIEVGGNDIVTKSPTIIEEIAYRDTWGRGVDSYASMILERLRLIRGLMSDDASAYVQVGPQVNHVVRQLMDEVFGTQGPRREIIWKRVSSRSHGALYPATHDSILFYSNSENVIWNQLYEPLDERYVETKYRFADPDGRKFRKDNCLNQNRDRPNLTYEWNGHLKTWRWTRENMQILHEQERLIYTKSGIPEYKRYLDESEGTAIQSVWTDLRPVNSQANEDTSYATQKPETLLDRIIRASSNPGDLVADFFCGSGTTLAVAEKLGRKWIGADLGRFAIHTSRKRLIGVQRELKAAGKPWRSFEILNLGKYERQWFAGIDPMLPAGERALAAAAKEATYVALILEAYRAQPVEQSPPFHGVKDSAFIVVGPLDAPVNESTVSEAVEAARRMGVPRVDVLGFEFEMGLAPRAVDDAKAKGVAVALRYIPKDVFDRRAIDKGQVSFHDLAYVEARTIIADKKARRVAVSLSNFAVAYRQDGLDNLIEGMRPGTKVAVDDGQVVKLTKAKDGTVTRDVLTREWTDWIDYWAVDFDYASRPETIHETVTQADGTVKHVPQWTGRYIFENEWQSFRTRRDRALEVASATHDYATPGRKQIAVKVIDIFGNDTTKVIGVEV